MKRGLSKIGLSPVIASVLLIFLVLILAGIVFLWASGFFTEQIEKGGESVEMQCMKVKMRAAIAGDFRGQVNVEFEISNDGDIPIYGVSIKESRSGNDVVNFFSVNLDGGQSDTVTLRLESTASEKVIIYPVLLGGVVGGNVNKEYTCLENPQVITLNHE